MCRKLLKTNGQPETGPNVIPASAHYGDTLECTTCHSEHKASRALCSDCHVVEWSKKFQ